MAPRRGPLCLCGTRYGMCHRTLGHRGVCATFIGDRAFWFAWKDGRTPLGYGYFHHGRFSATCPPKKGAA
jgi:hypothetical protein